MGTPNTRNRAAGSVIDSNDPFELIIIGAGPAGLSAALAAKNAGLTYVVIERSCIVHTIFHYPTGLLFYSTPELIELGDVPLIVRETKPTREEALRYYRRFVEVKDLAVRTYEEVTSITGSDGAFTVRTRSSAEGSRTYRTGKVIIATGAFDQPNRLEVPGEELPKVSHYFKEAHPYYDRDILVVGGKSSAVETALTLYRAGARVTISYRKAEFTGVKYWVLPDLENRIKEGAIAALMGSSVKEIRNRDVVLEVEGCDHDHVIQNDFVFCMIGYEPDIGFLSETGISVSSDDRRPAHNPETFESDVPGIYVIGVITAGNIGNEVFIENSRAHGPRVVHDITSKLSERQKS
ncbi:MAG: YpdA family putative bacillithiol disulfide reductase [Candidatus Latescibacteria bacterium]|jgi:thioredoxin reductase (NADPH)|nr:YpdA family putative bacillithiol disulfide reductase [Candidatus Latescibacterota bacterium]